ncbi:MAG TPA: alpha/beta hydrolase [Dehalococcoidia bacterium]|nr:alpha/beta hydrolase [Dehalococcoidia bacterium]
MQPPALFIAGEQDLVLSFGGRSPDDLEERLRAVIPKLTKCVQIPNTGHWTQQKRPNEVNTELIEFLQGLDELRAGRPAPTLFRRPAPTP